MGMLLSRFARASAQIAPIIIAGLCAGAALGAGPYLISQKNREFQPGKVSMKKGETLRIINDDGELLHHAYLANDKFSFDSGDQEPGSKTDITFALAGDFDVLCAIHPKMRLTVHVK